MANNQNPSRRGNNIETKAYSQPSRYGRDQLRVSSLFEILQDEGLGWAGAVHGDAREPGQVDDSILILMIPEKIGGDWSFLRGSNLKVQSFTQRGKRMFLLCSVRGSILLSRRDFEAIATARISVWRASGA